MLKKILFSFMLIAVATVFTSCECHDDEDEMVDKRLYRTYIIGTWELIHENGYADYDCDGLKEFFDVDINKSERFSTVLVFNADLTCDIITYEDYRYNFCDKVTYNYSVSENLLRIYDPTHCSRYDKTFTIELFDKNYLSVTHYFRGCSTTFKFRYCYQ
jgi:hypothetical protein